MVNKKHKTHQTEDFSITRKEALKKAGKYAAFTATSMVTLLSPKESQATSPSPSNMPVWRSNINTKDVE